MFCVFRIIGHGNFGSVMKGTYMLTTGKKIPVAVKTLKDEDMPGQKVKTFLYVFIPPSNNFINKPCLVYMMVVISTKHNVVLWKLPNSLSFLSRKATQ